jgi:hypothetical protein
MTLPDEVSRHLLPEVFGRHGGEPKHGCDFPDGRRLRSVLEAAGFRVEALDRHRDGLWVGSRPADVLAWFARLPEGRLLEALDGAARRRLLDSLEAELDRRTREDGVYLAGTAGTAWIVACRPAVVAV